MSKDTNLPPGIKAAKDLDWSKLDEGFEMNENLSLKEGQAIEGEYLGPGPKIQMSEERLNEKTGEMEKTTLNTYRIRPQKGLVYNLMGSMGIDQRFSNLPIGSYVQLAHAGKEKAGKGQVNVYRFAVKPPKNAPEKTPPAAA